MYKKNSFYTFYAFFFGLKLGLNNGTFGFSCNLQPGVSLIILSNTVHLLDEF